MTNKDTEFEKHPAVIFLKKFIASISASIKEHSLKDSMYSLTLSTVISAGRLKSFLEEKVIQYDDDRTYFLINLDSIPQELLAGGQSTAKKLIDQPLSKREILVGALRDNGFTPKALSSKNLLSSEVRLHSSGELTRLDFFKVLDGTIMVPILEQMGFNIKPGDKNAGPCCYIIDLVKSNPVSTIEKKEDAGKSNADEKINFTPTFVKKLLEQNKLPSMSSYGNENKTGYTGTLRACYFAFTEDRDKVFKFLKETYPNVEFIKPTTGDRTILINDLNRKPRVFLAKEDIPVKTNSTDSDDCLGLNDIRNTLKEAKITIKTFNYAEKGVIKGADFDARRYYFYTLAEINAALSILQEKFPNAVIWKFNDKCIVVKSAGKMFARNFKNKAEKKSSKKATVVKKSVKFVHEIKAEQKTEVKKFTESDAEEFEKGFIGDLQQLMKKHDLIPKVIVVPRGVLIPDSTPDQIVLPHEALLKTGANGITISTKALRKFFKK